MLTVEEKQQEQLFLQLSAQANSMLGLPTTLSGRPPPATLTAPPQLSARQPSATCVLAAWRPSGHKPCTRRHRFEHRRSNISVFLPGLAAVPSQHSEHAT